MGIRTWHSTTGGATLPDYLGSRGGPRQCRHCRATRREPAHRTVVAEAGQRSGHRASLGDCPRTRGRKPQYDQATRDKIIQTTLRSKPKGMTHWSCRLMAEAQEVSKNTVNRLWQLHNLKPHLSRTLKLSRDAKFLEKLTDVVGLYLNPPDKTLVLCLDEKSQIQALDRTQPGLPLKKGRCGTMTHDYKRNGTTTLFAALNVLDG